MSQAKQHSSVSENLEMWPDSFSIVNNTVDWWNMFSVHAVWSRFYPPVWPSIWRHFGNCASWFSSWLSVSPLIHSPLSAHRLHVEVTQTGCRNPVFCFFLISVDEEKHFSFPNNSLLSRADSVLITSFFPPFSSNSQSHSNKEPELQDCQS